MFGRKRYVIVEEEDRNSGFVWILLVLAGLVYFVLKFAHIILALLFGYGGYLLAAEIVKSKNTKDIESKIGVYIICMALLSGLGFLIGLSLIHI